MAACNQSNDYQKITNNPDLYAYTVHELNQVVMGNNFSPIVASRNYAYAAIAGYEVVAAGDPINYQSLAVQLKGLAQMPKPKDKHRAVSVPGHSEIFGLKKKNFTLPRLFAATLAPKN